MRERLNAGFRFRDPHMAVTCETEEIQIELDPNELAEKPAQEIAAAIERGILANPNRTHDGKRRLFVRTGTLARSIEARPTGEPGVFHIEGPPGYLQDDAVLDRLREAVPAVADPLSEPRVRAAIEKASTGTVTIRRGPR